jgi:hypothetical protein
MNSPVALAWRLQHNELKAALGRTWLNAQWISIETILHDTISHTRYDITQPFTIYTPEDLRARQSLAYLAGESPATDGSQSHCVASLASQ